MSINALSTNSKPKRKQFVSLLLPTRGRPRLCERFFKSVAETAGSLEDMEIILYIDDDDTESHELNHPDIKIERIIGPRRSMGEYNSLCLSRSRGDIIVLVNDDMIIRTSRWDELIREADNSFADKIYLAYGNDLFKGGKLCTFPILSRRTCEILVEPYPVAYRGAFIDYHLFDIFMRLKKTGYDRIKYFDDVVFEHLHYRTGKAEIDETYTSRGRMADDPTFLALIEERRRAANHLTLAIENKPLPAFEQLPVIEVTPSSPPGALIYYVRQLFLDPALPLRWKSWLTIWFFGRYLADKGWLWPFVK